MSTFITIHNVETGEVETRLMNNEELENYNANQAKAQTEAAFEAAKAAEKAALLEKLGLTAEEVAALLS